MNNYQVYLSFDNAMLKQYTNTEQLLRAHKDIAANKIILLEKQQDAITFKIGSQQVKLSSQGIHMASCSCQAHGHCAHIIGAILWLQANAASLDIQFTPINQSDHYFNEQSYLDIDFIAHLFSIVTWIFK
ncbi:hypothetical protein JMI89_07860 [Frischella sp. Ac48]|uniref:SWIM-type domain-containing protein n=1 Tax=Frischella japonica TaxID=2741544 RepID=A0ABR7QWR0_9GAMM|nr:MULTISPECIES: hypothetical protein [Frischella]MBC9130630.1 hypothetical protein [Frischella japonica]MBX4133544.1 hypothetical protein [Frischella sp. Ac48]